jgi:LmbE family N-acetylglucosaminyl deacetylase
MLAVDPLPRQEGGIVVATVVMFHAHPDDEAIATGGTMIKAAEEGHRVVLVTATNGERGEVPPGLLREGETLAERRLDELRHAARLLGVARLEPLGYMDSGMMGTPDNDVPGCFWRTDVEEAARRVADILVEERADALTIYDEDGSYGHPDHIQVHRVGVRAGHLGGTPKLYESVIGRQRLKQGLEQLADTGFEMPPDLETESLGVPDETITTSVDVVEYLDRKRAAMEAHASQMPPESFFLAMPPEAFARGFGIEEYRLRDAPPGLREDRLV